MNDYVLILHEPADSPFAAMSLQEMQSVIERYSEWAGMMGAQGRLKGGNKLEDATARHLMSKNGSVSILDGPFPETKEIVGGYFILTAASYEEAAELASSCPHLDFGRIEIRKVELT